MNGQRGQAAVELVGLLPLVAAIGFAAYSALAAQRAGEQAGAAAEAGAMAHLQDREPRAAAQDALPRGAHAAITVHDRRVTVRVRPRVPFLGAWLEASATADPGPDPVP